LGLSFAPQIRIVIKVRIHKIVLKNALRTSSGDEKSGMVSKVLYSNPYYDLYLEKKGNKICIYNRIQDTHIRIIPPKESLL
jgi:hypothetical protein